MFRINRLRINVKTSSGDFGFDEKFDKRVNFIASYGNTQGKSSCIEAFYYCLGLEELIGGKKEKSLKPVFKKSLKYKGAEIPVLESNFFLEIQNGNSNIITIYRAANKKNFDSNLITVYFGDMIQLDKGIIRSEDMYLHSQGSATSIKGFHMFLEKFINWKLPEVPTYDEVDRKLYLQTVFSTIFIEQKRGWADLFATLPTYFKVKDPKKRIIEFLIGLDSLKNEKLSQKYKVLETELINTWKEKYKNISEVLKKANCKIYGVPSLPTVLDERFTNQLSIFIVQEDGKEIIAKDYIEGLHNNIEKLNKKNIKVGDNVDDLQNELLSIKDKISKYEKIITDKRNELVYANGSIESIIHSLEIINKDILNNKDALKLKNLGSSEEWLINKNICPTCQQKIHDSLLPQNIEFDFMTIEENIKHLEAQKKMMDFAIDSHKRNKENVVEDLIYLEEKIVSFRKIANSIVNDIYSNDENISETIIRKKLMIESEIDLLEENINIVNLELPIFKGLSEQWRELLKSKNSLPNDKFTQSDLTTLKSLRDFFVFNLGKFGYSSILDMSTIQISDNKLLPSTEGFDMKFDSSASDNIRAIWAFTLALMQTSNKFNGNHPNILIFDEPDQQSVIIDDMKNLFETLINLKDNCQVIFGITLKDEETRKVISNLNKDEFKLILFNDYAIRPQKS
ncbi:hypothetical protein PP175_03930 [Aneurinibacillus sp. Ricciae_BoGa-3]|uniref:hypothetical protein n=1 Tax=Aneurinibacillus sp. Ricciae_BoGa-3 TaxID=3022697 RepID=UPI00234095C4|nr:hypothetical protein [Aneurinibacillus sp. Ricciae_BoGa-3]WCK55146.1 hypothetical protein PP175_03930 [Aneurinibacillus sp. Ricciae_BoGa-3]